jgi:hypothetical protein
MYGSREERVASEIAEIAPEERLAEITLRFLPYLRIFTEIVEQDKTVLRDSSEISLDAGGVPVF